MANRRTDVEVMTAAIDWFEGHEPVRDWRWMFEYNRAGEVCRACILGAVFVVMGNAKPPDSVCDAIYRAHRELFPNRALSEPFTKTEILILYRRTIEQLAARKSRTKRPAKAGDEVFAQAESSSVPEETMGVIRAMTSSKTTPKRRRDKAFYLDLIKKRFQQIRETGFVGLPGVESLAQNESQLRELDLVTLKAIAHAARNLLKATATLPSDCLSLRY
jgi:hypothetical protein